MTRKRQLLKYEYMEIQYKTKPAKTAVKIGTSRQVVIPKKAHDQLGLEPGDYLDVELKEGKLIFTPKTLIDRRIAESIKDYGAERAYGPFKNPNELVKSLKVNLAKRKSGHR